VLRCSGARCAVRSGLWSVVCGRWAAVCGMRYAVYGMRCAACRMWYVVSHVVYCMSLLACRMSHVTFRVRYAVNCGRPSVTPRDVYSSLAIVCQSVYLHGTWVASHSIPHRSVPCLAVPCRPTFFHKTICLIILLASATHYLLNTFVLPALAVLSI
jgi:hypothetical protein